MPDGEGALGEESLAATGIYTQLVDQMAKEIALNTRTALDGDVEAGRPLKEARGLYEPEFEGWDRFVSGVLEWSGRF